MSQNTKSKVAVVGLGNIGQVVATNLVKGNRPVIVSARTVSKAQELATKLGPLAQPLEIEDAIREADIIVLSIWFASIKEFFEQYPSLLKGKIIVDPSNPILPNDQGGFDKIIGDNESAGEINASHLPEDAILVKAFGTLGAGSLSQASGQKPEAAVLFYASDDRTVDSIIDTLITDAGFDPYRLGGLDQSIRLEVFGDLHEYGALGKTVTLSEAKSVLAS